MTFCRADEVAAWAGIATAAVRQAAAKAKLIEILIIMTITRNERGNVNAREGLSVPHKLVAWVPHSQPFWPWQRSDEIAADRGKPLNATAATVPV